MFPLSRFSHPHFLRSAFPPRPARRRVALAAAFCAALTCGATLDAGFAGGSTPVPPGLSDAAATALSGLPERGRPARGPGMNILLVGLDRRAGLSQATKDRLHVNGQQCDCTDVMMLLHISADRDRVSVVSIPRDSYVRFASHRDTGKGFGKITNGTTRHLGKINSAYAHGGPSLTVRTVERVTGVRVDHYAEADFTGFVDAVDRLKGARVCTNKPLRDENSGLRLLAGTHLLDGDKSLRYVRARHVHPPGDLGRVRRQQRLLAEMLTSLTSDKVAGNPVALLRAATALAGSVRTDSGLTPGRLSRLGRELHGLTARRTEFATVPMSEFDRRVPVWGSTLAWDEPRARALFADLRADRPITGNPATGPEPGARPVAFPPEKISVRVDGRGEAARRMAQDLRDNGFHVLDERRGGAGGTRGGRTEVSFDPHFVREAETVAAALPGAVLRPVPVSGTEHLEVFSVRPGTEGTEVSDVDVDRSSVEGAPVTGDTLDCDG
ncbi:MAG: LCP family protein [Streptomyces sp.]|uniref:LCP family protein n=1 Tax=Streptomyces sp. TaxID=1931 RepID=UPI003D6C1E18